MKVVEFPAKAKKKKAKCTCVYLYRMAFNPDTGLFGAMVGKSINDDEVLEMSLLTGFEYESEAEAAAWGFIEALHYVHNQGML